MEVFGQTSKLNRIMSDDALIKKQYGTLSQNIILRRDQLIVAKNLAEIPAKPEPPRRHNLKSVRKDEFAIDVSGNYRLIFKAFDSDDNLTTKPENAVSIMITGIEDYH
ncbi:MAG: plasmid maintenance system killer protein [Streptococcaceae bacterium]|jgi:proteic killer suppression protein|nr:plasmid maintenance system killer protein [Streptococcaceae bacterium]